MAVNLNNNNNLQQTDNTQNQSQNNSSGTQPTTTQNQVSNYNNNSVQPVTSSTVSSQNQSTDPQPKAQGTGYSNVQDYYGANQGNNLSQAVSGGVQNVTNQANSGLNTDQSDYNNQYNQAYQAQQGGQNLYTGLNNLNWSGDPNSADQAIQNANTTQNQQYAQQLAQGYNGPQGINNADQLSARSTALQQLAQGLNTSGGRQAALQQFVGQGQYTQGQQGLDSLLLGQNSSALNNARTQALQSANNINNTIGTDQSKAATLQNLYNTTGSNLTGLLNNGLASQMQSYLNNAATNQNTANTTATTDINNALLGNGTVGGGLTDAETNALINQGLGGNQNTYTLTGGQLAGQLAANNTLGASDVATSNDLATRNALAQLSNGAANPNLAFLNNATGTANTNPFTTTSEQAIQGLLNNAANTANTAEQGQNYYDVNQNQNVGYNQYLNDLGANQQDQSLLGAVAAQANPNQAYNPNLGLAGQASSELTNPYTQNNPQLTNLLNSLNVGQNIGGTTAPLSSSQNAWLYNDLNNINGQASNAASQYGAFNEQQGIGNTIQDILNGKVNSQTGQQNPAVVSAITPPAATSKTANGPGFMG